MPALLSMAQQFSGLPIKSLIAGPLNAAAEANAMMAQTQTAFMLNTCFKGGESNDNDKKGNTDNSALEPIMITFTAKRSVLDEQGNPKPDATMSFTLPLLTIIPLNSLAVDDVKVHFEMEVKSSSSQSSETSKETDTSAKAGFTAGGQVGPFKVEVHGSVSTNSKSSSKASEHYSSSNQAKYEIDVHAGQLPLPQGVTTIIDTFTKNIAPIMVKSDDDKGDDKK